MGHRVVRCSVLGQTEIEAEGIRLTPESERQFGVALYFCAHAGDRVARDEVAQLFWPEHPIEAARHCLRQTLYRLRAVGIPVRSGSQGVLLDDRAVDADYAPVAVEGAPMSAYLALSSVVVLPGYAPRFSAPFAEWLEGFRTDLGARLRRGLVRSIADARSRGRYADVERLARHCLTLDPLNEEATLALAEAVALAGSKVEAVGMIERYLAEIGERRDLRVSPAILRSRVSELYVPDPSTSPPHIIGRDSEIEWLASAFTKAEHGLPTFACLTGEAGVGKTAVVGEFLRRTSLRNSVTIRVRCQPSDANTSYAVVSDIAQQLRRLPGALGASPFTLNVIDAFTHLDEPSTDMAGLRQLDSALIQDALLDLGGAVADEATVVVFVDDIHWIDAKSRRILSSLVADRSPLRMLIVACARRPLDAGQESDASVDCSYIAHHRVRPLTQLHAKQLLSDLLAASGSTISDERADDLAHLTGGNPLFLTQLAGHLRGAHGTDPVPDSLRSLLAERLQALSPQALLALQAFSCLGRAMSPSRLERMLELPSYSLLAALRELDEAGLIESDNQELHCRHQLITDAVRQVSSAAVSLLLNRRAAQVLEQDATATGDPSTLRQCAEHYEAAGHSQDARRVLEKLGQYLLRIGAPSDASRIFERALSYCTTPQQELKLTGCLLNSLRQAREWRPILQVYERRQGLVDVADGQALARQDDSLLEIEARLHLCENMRHELPLVLEKLETRSLNANRHAALAVIGLIMADNLIDPAAANQVASHLTLNRETLESSTDPLVLSAALIYHTTFGDLDTAVYCARRMVRLWPPRIEADIRVLQRARWAAVPLAYVGDFSSAEELLQMAFHTACRRRLWSEASGEARALAELAILKSNLVSASAWITEARKYAARASDPDLAADISEAATRIELLRGTPDRARTSLSVIQDNEPRRPEPRPRMRYLTLKVAFDLEEHSLRLEDVRELAGIIERTYPYGDHDLAVCVLAAALRLTEGDQGAKRLLGEYRAARRERYSMPELLKERFLRWEG